MLDAETKRKIDSARDILVGKVPDPKAQVEQITTALIYKFMDDMDREAEELGGKATFLTGELQIYQWANLMSKELGGEARLNLYMSALLAFSKTPNIPEIFRTIFKDAFLPYRDPETLNLFLKQIDWFDYDHSENLGDAFEYLLSVLGSQGDAGQFRTPRHIIDFIVEVIEPKKTDTILDPSCGTAGFLISAYKHILANNTALTPSEKKQLVQHFTGYDISPDMVRLSLVNLYLHSFPTPKVYEYDTLTSEDRWQENYDVILANPPFMTPKGGIRPHNRFSVQAKRSEVLFVDYIAEHLNLNGRAGIIVPEGIIFQSANAYKALRKMLVDNDFLWAVVSLPAGIFQPYSGVKTSILLLDRGIAKQRDDVLFIKIASDGYDLGAQRRENTSSDLPTALNILKAHRRGEAVDNPFAQIVAKAKIAETGDYNLTGDRYRETKARENMVYPLVKLGDVCEINPKKSEIRELDDNTLVSFVPMERLNEREMLFEPKENRKLADVYNAYTYFKENDVLVAKVTPCFENGKSGIARNLKNGIGFGSSEFTVFRASEKLNPRFLYEFISSNKFIESGKEQMSGTGGLRRLTKFFIENFEIPLPPLEIQNAIVTEIEQWQKVIDGAKQVIANYRPTIEIKPEWEMVKLVNACEINPKKSELRELDTNTLVSFVPMECLNEREMLFKPKESRKLLDVYSGYTYFKENDVLVAKVTPCFENGKSGIAKNLENGIGFGSSEFTVLRASEKLNPQFLYVFISSDKFIENGKKQMSGTGGLRRLTKFYIENFEIPLPTLEIQNAIIEQIEQERTAVESCKTLIALFETKIKNKISQVWGE